MEPVELRRILQNMPNKPIRLQVNIFSLHLEDLKG